MTMQNQDSNRGERREETRTFFSLPQPATIDYEGESHGVEMIDFSPTGAKFRFSGQNGGALLKRDTETVCSIHLPTGKTASFRASIRWTIRYPEGVTLGVRFVEDVDARLATLISEQEGTVRAG
jgi:hypothetical protein